MQEAAATKPIAKKKMPIITRIQVSDIGFFFKSQSGILPKGASTEPMTEASEGFNFSMEIGSDIPSI
jgi:hypothetical protein